MIDAKYKKPLFVIVLIIVALLAYSLLTRPDTRSVTEKVGNAISELPQGIDKAARELENRTPAQKLNDAAKDAGETMNEKPTP
ncbi:MAG: hypothetical protein PHY92_10900 [Alphaproteobacteria bacterium]|nr:hypothetical protein [Alphaproteobacteria bacterium]